MRAQVLSNGQFAFSFATFAGKTYVPEFKNSATDANWQSLATLTGDGTRQTLIDTNATGAKRFYRVRVR